MIATAKTLRYQLPKKAVKTDCPQCGSKHKKTWSRYVDTKTNELLPEDYGRCDRESNCGYSLSPYQKTASGLSYAEEVYQYTNENKPLVVRPSFTPKRINQAEQPKLVCSIPNEVFRQSLGHHDKNQFARLLVARFGEYEADKLLRLFQIGTSSRWPGACIFWYVDEQGRIRGGQIKLFDENWHTVKYIDGKGNKRSKTSWVHSSLKNRLEKEGKSLPDWLTEYEEKAERSPCLFGLPQLLTAPYDKPIAIVEAPKTAVIGSHYIPAFIWLAVGSKAYLNAERLAPLRGRRIKLYPDLNALEDWSRRVEQLQANGFMVEVSDYLENSANDQQKQAGLDLADFLLQQPPTVGQLTESETIDELTKPEAVTLTSIKLPTLIEYYWTQFSRPPKCFNKIGAHKALMRCLDTTTHH